MNPTRPTAFVLFQLLVAALLLPADAATAQEAGNVWSAKCASCHGVDGKANTQMGKKEAIPDFSQAAWQKSVFDAELRKTIAKGSPRNSKMRAYEDKLTPQQIGQLVTHIRAFGKAKSASAKS